jgi:hypothetical protein
MGLAARAEPYKATLRISWDNGKGGRSSTEAEISFTVSNHTAIYSINIDITSWNFGKVKEGYSKPPRHRFKVTNTGNVELTGIQTTFKGSDAKSFEVVAFNVVQQKETGSPSKGVEGGVGAKATTATAKAEAKTKAFYVSNAAKATKIPVALGSKDTKDLVSYKLAPGQYAIVDVSPKVGLSARKTPYRTDLIVATAEEGASASSSVKFEVDLASGGKGGDMPDTSDVNGEMPDTGDVNLEAIFAALILSGLLALILLLLMKRRASRRDT